MKNKLLALFLFSVTLLGLAFYLLTEFEEELTPSTISEQKTLDTKVTLQLVTGKINSVPLQADQKEDKKVFIIGGKKYILQQSLNQLELVNQDEESLGMFSYAQDTSLQKIYGNTDLLFLRLGNENYIIDPQSGVRYSFSLVFTPMYVKKNGKQFLIQTEKGIFSYDIASKNIEFQHIFSDFLVYNDSVYVGYIASNDIQKQEYFSLEPLQKNAVVSYDTKTKKLEVLEETDKNIVKIYESGKSVYFETADEEVYRLRNF